MAVQKMCFGAPMAETQILWGMLGRAALLASLNPP